MKLREAAIWNVAITFERFTNKLFFEIHEFAIFLEIDCDPVRPRLQLVESD